MTGGTYGRGFSKVQPGSPLTRREAAILDLVSQGCTNTTIAARLGLSVDMVKLSLRAVYVRLSAHDRAHAVRRGFERGYLRPDVERRVAS